MANLSAIKLPNGTTYNLKDNVSGYITTEGAPVQSVNGKTGAVTLTAADVGALTTHNTYTISNSGNGNAVTSVSLTGTTFTVTKGTTFLTSHQTYSSFTGKPTSNATPAFGGTVTISQISQSTSGQVSGTDRTITIPSTIATYNGVGLIKPWYSYTAAATGPTAATATTAVAVNAKSTTAGRYYPVEIDKDGRLFVNVPWVDTDVNTTYSAGTGLSLSGTTFNHSNSITSGTVSDGGSTRTLAFSGTFKIPSVTYDAQGHITSTSTITLTLPANPNTDTNTWRPVQVNGTQILAGTTGTNALNLKAGTNVSISNSNGTVTISSTDTDTDAKLQIAAVTSGTTYYPIVGANSTTAATRQYDATGIAYTGTNGTANGSNGNALLTLGNNTASTTANWKKGTVRLYGTTAYYTDLVSGAPSANRTITFPNATGTVALTSDIPSVPTKASSATTGISATTTATKTTLGTAFTIPNVTSAGSASTWAFEDISCDDITSWSAGSGSASISGAVNSSDSTQLDITISHTHTAPSLSYTARTVSSKKSGSNGSAPSLGTAFTVPNVTGNTSATVSISDSGHTHNLS